MQLTKEFVCSQSQTGCLSYKNTYEKTHTTITIVNVWEHFILYLSSFIIYDLDLDLEIVYSVM